MSGYFTLCWKLKGRRFRLSEGLDRALLPLIATTTVISIEINFKPFYYLQNWPYESYRLASDITN